MRRGILILCGFCGERILAVMFPASDQENDCYRREDDQASSFDDSRANNATEDHASRDDREKKKRGAERDQGFVRDKHQVALSGWVGGTPRSAVANAKIKIKEQADNEPYKEADPIFDCQAGH